MQQAQEKERRSARREKERQISQDMEVEGVKRTRKERGSGPAGAGAGEQGGQAGVIVRGEKEPAIGWPPLLHRLRRRRQCVNELQKEYCVKTKLIALD